jgi:SAM-dependent methyltransferase
MTTGTIDQGRLEALLERLGGDIAATFHAATVVLGHRLGLYRAMFDGGAQTASELAARTGYQPRLVKEWLNAQVASEYCEYDPQRERYSLTPEQAACLVDESSPTWVVGSVLLGNAIHRAEERVRGAFAGDGKFGWEQHADDLFAAGEQTFRPDYAGSLVGEWIPALDGMPDRLRAGARVADVACGFGTSTILLAQAFPQSTFAGFDFHAPSIAAARKAAAVAGVTDRVTFEVAPADGFGGTDYDLVCVFNALHDMGDPVGAARHIRDALATDGIFMLVESNAGDRLEDNINPIGRGSYSASTFICVPNALSQGGIRTLGNAAGEGALRQVTAEAGFTGFRRATETPFYAVFDVRP